MNESKDPAGGDKQVKGERTAAFGETISMGDKTASEMTNRAHAEANEWVGRTVGRYEVTGVLGVGGMGVVLKARDTTIDREVALKVLPEQYSLDSVALNRFLAEAKSAGKLNHPNAVTIYGISEVDGVHYIAMEWAPGGSARDQLERIGHFSIAEATRLIIDAAKGLGAAHQAGLIHRDIKPANLLMMQDGSVKVCDFGLAKRTQSDSMHMTKAGQVIGTPYFMSPEQCESREVDARSDIYSLGATYYSLLTGRNPYQDSDSVVQVMFAHCNADPPDPRAIKTEVPQACSQIVTRAMATHPEDRYQTMDEFRIDLEAVMASISGTDIHLPSQSTLPATTAAKAEQSRRAFLPIIGAATLLVIVIGVAAFFATRPGKNGSNAKEGNAGGGKDDNAITAPTGEPIKIGILHSLSGTMAESESPVVDAALMAVEEINKSGGLLGRPVKAVVADGRSKSEVFAAEARRLIEKEKVVTVFGCWTSADRKTIVPIFEELDHLLLYPVQYEGIEESPNVVYLGAAPNQQIIPAVKWAYAFQNKRRFFLVGSDYVFPRVAHEIIKDQLKQLGAELAGESFLRLGSDDVTDVVRKIQQAKPDVILNSINGDSNTAFFRALRDAGVTPDSVPTISFSIGEEELRHLDLSTMAGDYAAWNYFQSIDSNENKQFVESFRDKFGPQRVVTDPMESSYFGVKLWAQAVTSAQSSDTEAIRRALRNQRMNSPGGNVRIDPATQHTFKTPRIGQVQANGQFEIVWTAAKPEPPLPYPATRTTEKWRAFLHDLFTGWGDRWSAP